MKEEKEKRITEPYGMKQRKNCFPPAVFEMYLVMTSFDDIMTWYF